MPTELVGYNMIKVSKKSQYGLRAMVCLAKHYKSKEISSVKMISQKEGISFDFLEKIISQLERAGLVISKKGVLGGYSLSKSPSKISVKDIVSALEGTKKLVSCVLCKRLNKCSAKSVWAKLDNCLNKTLEEIKLKDLIK